MSSHEEDKAPGTDGMHSGTDKAPADGGKNYGKGRAVDGSSDGDQAKSNEAQTFSGALKGIAGRVKLHKGAQENKDREKRIFTGKLGKVHGSLPSEDNSPQQNAHAAPLAANELSYAQLVSLPAGISGLNQNLLAAQLPVSEGELSPNAGGEASGLSGSAVGPVSQGVAKESAAGMALPSAPLFALGPSTGTHQQPINHLSENETGDEATFLNTAGLYPGSDTPTAVPFGYAGTSSDSAIQNVSASDQAQQDVPSHIQSDGFEATAQMQLSAEQASPAQAAKRDEKHDINSSSAAPAVSQVEDTNQQPVTGPANPASIQPASAVEAARALAAELANSRDDDASAGMKTKAVPETKGAEAHSMLPHASAGSVGIVMENGPGMQSSDASDPGAVPASSAAANEQSGTLTATLAFGPATGNLTGEINGLVTGHEATSDNKGDHGDKGGDSSSAMPGASSNNSITPAANLPSPAGLSNTVLNPPVLANAPATAGVLGPAPTSGAKRPVSSGTLMQNAAADSASVDKIKTGDVHVARIWERDGHMEIRIGMKTDDFGKVEVRTQLRDSQVGLAVESERGDLKTYLSPELPGLQTALHQHSLHLESMDFSHPGGQSAGSQGESYRGSSAGGFDGERQSHAPPGNWPMQPSRSVAAEIAEALVLETSWPRTAGINIHA